jgi:diaminopimelate dehydrogenase
MKRRVAIMGLGRVGNACAEAIAASEDLMSAGIVRRPESLSLPLPHSLRGVPVAAHASEFPGLDLALLCLPPPLVLEAAKNLPDADYRSYRHEIHQIALRHNVAAVVGAGWEPGMISLFRDLFAMLCPKGHTETRDRPGISLHHTLAARSVSGVKDALCAEYRVGSSKTQRYVYVELEDGADLPNIQETIRNDPLFLDQETLVLPVESVAMLEDEGHGLVLERWGTSAGKAHQRFLLEGRFDRVAVTAEIMVAAARALPRLHPGAHALADLPPSALSREL